MGIETKIVLTEKAPFFVTINSDRFKYMVKGCSSHDELVNGCKRAGLYLNQLQSKNPSDYYLVIGDGRFILKKVCTKIKI